MLLILVVIGAALGAGLRPLVMPVSRRLGMVRDNFAGVPIPTACGWLLVAVTAVGVGITELVDVGMELPLDREAGRAFAAAALLFGALGWLDDRYGDRTVKGLRGHLRALLRERRVTTGLVKAVGGVVFGAALAAWVERARPGDLASLPAAVALGGAVIALSANAINLLDLRPLRAIKGFGLYLLLVLLLTAALRPSSIPALVWLALPTGALAAYVPLEARCGAMLGDTGANALGALAGLAAVWTLPVFALVVLVAALLALHLYAERRSITAALAAHPLLDRLDRWGWTEGRPQDA